MLLLIRFVARYMEISMFLLISFFARYTEISTFLLNSFVSGYMEITMFLLNSFVSGYMKISMFLFEQLCLGVHGNFQFPFEQLGFLEENGNVHLPFAKISSINSFLTVCFVFRNYNYTLGRLSTKNSKVFDFLTNNSHLTAECTLFIF